MKLNPDTIRVFRGLLEAHNKHIATLKAKGLLPKDTEEKTPEEFLQTCIYYFAINFYSNDLKKIRDPHSERLFADILRIATIQTTQEQVRQMWGEEYAKCADFFGDDPEEPEKKAKTTKKKAARADTAGE